MTLICASMGWITQGTETSIEVSLNKKKTRMLFSKFRCRKRWTHMRAASTNPATLSSVHHYLCISSRPPDSYKHYCFHPDRGDECSENNSSGPFSIFVPNLRCCCSVVALFFVCNLNFYLSIPGCSSVREAIRVYLFEPFNPQKSLIYILSVCANSRRH